MGKEKTGICQVFNLDKKIVDLQFVMDKLNEKERKKTSVKRLSLNPEAMQKVIQKLEEKGYKVLGSDTMTCGVPISLLVAGSPDSLCNTKKDFFEIAHEEGLDCFQSGEVYFPINWLNQTRL